MIYSIYNKYSLTISRCVCLGDYPNTAPTILLDDYTPPEELDEHLQALCSTLQGSAALYCLYEAVSEWTQNSENTEKLQKDLIIEESPNIEEFQVCFSDTKYLYIGHYNQVIR